MAKRKVCGRFRCEELVSVGGLCRRHFEKADQRHRRFMEAADVLHSGLIDKETIRPGSLREELQRIQKWWGEVCTAEIAGREHPLLKEETRFGTDWCILIAQEIIDAERDVRAGKVGDTEVRRFRREQAWKRFENLEQGLMSNGIAS